MADFAQAMSFNHHLLMEISSNIDAMTVVVITVSVLLTLGCFLCTCLIYRCCCSKKKGADDDNDILEWKAGYTDTAV